jgi:hypothetical protein
VKAYYSNYLVSEYALFPPGPYKARGWVVSFEDEPCQATSRRSATIDGKSYPAKAVIIHAASRQRAQYAADTIHAALCLESGESPIFPRTTVVPADLDSAETDDTPQQGVAAPRDVEVGRLPLACLIAVKASYRRAYQYALFKYLLSHHIFSTGTMDLDPSGWWPTRFVWDSAEHHLCCAYAIVLAYSVLEELSLDLRASQKNPSRIGEEWNPTIKEELEARLKKAHIDLSETLLWILRDTPTRIERTRPPRIQLRAPWASLKVRDSEVALIDAIAYVSWLRSKVSAHKLRELAASLSYYDVTNAQHLARRLLLERLGFWRYQERLHEGSPA